MRRSPPIHTTTHSHTLTLSPPDHVYVDAHVLATPVVADINGDGADDLVVPVSWYFDKETYAEPKAWRELGLGVNVGASLIRFG